MNATVQKWGNSLALRIPSALAKEIHFYQGSVVDVVVVKGRMIVKPKGQSRYVLSQLLKGVTKSNRHSERDWGRAVGREAW